MIRDLIYDVGMNNGDDTAFYLAQGYRVVAVEADPVMAKTASCRFAHELSTGRLTVLNVGVSEASGCAEFWICDRRPEWNSFDRRIALRDGEAHHPVKVPTRRFEQILAEHGYPYYLKIDIEGNDPLCVHDLTPSDLPSYISLECECAGSVEHQAEAEGIQSLRLLHDKGYRQFKLVDQDKLAVLEFPVRGGNGAPAKRSRWQEFQRKLARKVAPHWSAPQLPATTMAGERITHRFPAGSSGLWGEDIDGDWLDFEAASRCYQYYRDRHFADQSEKPYTFWCDWHAKV